MKTKSRLLKSDKLWGSLAVLLVLLQFWWLPGEAGSAADSWSNTIDGKLGLFQLLSELFPSVERNAREVTPPASSTLLLIAPDRLPTDAEQRRLYEFVYSGGQLVFAPSMNEPDVWLPYLNIQIEQRAWNQAPVVDGALTPMSPAVPQPVPGEVTGSPAETSPPDASGSVQATADFIDGVVSFRSHSAVIEPSSFDCETLLTSSGGSVEAATWRLGSGRVLVCSSADLFSNRSLLSAPARRLVVRLIERVRRLDQDQASGEPPIVISEYFNASDSYQQTGALFSPSLRIGTLQLLLVAVLGLWLAFHRFGPPDRVESLQRRSLTESAQAVGNLQYRLRDGGSVVAAYTEYLRSRIRGRYGAAVRLDDATALAKRSGLPEVEIVGQLREAKELSEAPHVTPAKSAAMLRWLARLHERLCGSRSRVIP